jgi:DNA-binding NarL/FixJ family response regulator
MPIRVVLVDDHAVVRSALRALLVGESGIAVVGEACNGREAISMAKVLTPDIVVMDIGMPDMNGIEATQVIVDRFPGTQIVALSRHDSPSSVGDMIKAGARAYVTKAAEATELIRAIRAVGSGQSYLCPRAAAAVMQSGAADAAQDDSRRMHLTRREREVLKLLAEGERTTGIASRICLAESTVEVHRRNLMRKLDLHSVAGLTKYAIREGLTEL